MAIQAFRGLVASNSLNAGNLHKSQDTITAAVNLSFNQILVDVAVTVMAPAF